MHTSGSYPKVAALSLILSVASFGCDAKSAEEDAPGASAADTLGRPLGDIELPVSLRTGDPEPSSAVLVEATTEQLRIGQTPVVALDRGKVADADRSNGIIPKLDAALKSSSRSTLALRMQANIPYETIALVMNTAKQSGIHNVAFRVRQTGASSPKTGWIVVNGFVMSSKAEGLPEIPGAEYKSWNAFTDRWQEIFDGCRTSPTGNCAYVNENVAQGGTLRMELMSSGRGINVNFFRRGLSPEQEAEEEKKQAQELAAKKEDFLQGRITEEEMVEHLLLGHPSTYALFQFRYQEALKTSDSALGKVIGPMCTEKCGMILTADEISHLVRIVSMLGAAFPDGTRLPALAFEMPWTEKPKPADLQEFIETQNALSGG